MHRLLLTICLLLPALASATADRDLERIVAEHWQTASKEKVMFRKDPDSWRPEGQLASVTAAARLRRQAFNEQLLQQLEAIDPNQLSASNLVTYKVFLYERRAEKESYQQAEYLYPLTNRSGWHLSFATAPAGMTFSRPGDYEAYLESLADFPRYNDEYIALLEEAISKGHTQFCTSMQGFELSISAQLASRAEDSGFYRPFLNIPTSIHKAQRDDLQLRAKLLIEKAVIPAYAKLLEFYVADYAPACRLQEGISSTPGGEALYNYLLRYFTTTDMTPTEIHQLGLKEVSRIQAEMKDLIATTAFKGSFSDFLNFLRTDPRFYTDTPQDLLEKTALVAKRMDGQLPRLFGTLPRLPYDIQEIPASIAEKTTGAYYSPAPGDGRTPGSYYVNTSLLKSRPLYVIEALSFHEAVPGHHLQMALSLELDLPEFRRVLYYSAFGEGWGLYAEALGKEVGFYTDPYSDFGRLTYEMWRACRLVVDTGLHAFGWSRQQAIDYMAARTALSIHEVTSEVDRYITWPAQATAYKIGELRIRELRQRAENVLGERFDLREFHDQVLANGSLPIAVLEQLVGDWINRQAQQ